MRISDWSSDVCSSDLSVDTALQLLAGQFCKPSFDLIDPGRRSRCEVSMPMRAACEPGLDLWRLVGRIVVHHEVDVWPLGDRGVDQLEEEIGRASFRERVCQSV